jgi:hypothetical protein
LIFGASGFVLIVLFHRVLRGFASSGSAAIGPISAKHGGPCLAALYEDNHPGGRTRLMR